MAETAMLRKKQPVSGLGRLSFAPVVVEKPKAQKPKREKVKADPRLVAAARELRDRYLEQYNSGMVLGGVPQGKYAVGRELIDSASAAPRLLLPAA
jgi:hypothetical protein